MSRSVSAPSSVTNTSPCWNRFIVPGSTLRYGSSFCMVTRRPRALRRLPRLLAVRPLPSEEATPPVTNTCFVVRADCAKDDSRDRVLCGAGRGDPRKFTVTRRPPRSPDRRALAAPEPPPPRRSRQARRPTGEGGVGRELAGKEVRQAREVSGREADGPGDVGRGAVRAGGRQARRPTGEGGVGRELAGKEVRQAREGWGGAPSVDGEGRVGVGRHAVLPRLAGRLLGYREHGGDLAGGGVHTVHRGDFRSQALVGPDRAQRAGLPGRGQ